MSAGPDPFLRQRLATFEAEGLRRVRRTVTAAGDVKATVAGRPVINFAGNDYLGLAGHPAVTRALQRGAELYGVGAGASHLVSGHGPAHQALEEALAEFTGRSRALLFSTGYMANLGVISALTGRGDMVLQDRLNHASLLDGARLAGTRLRRYAHRDPDALAARLAAVSTGVKLVATDGVFSMDGDLAPLDALAATAADHGAWLMVDDAHGLGVVGAEGRGSVAAFGLGEQEVPILVGTLGKAFGTFGAFVAGAPDLIEFLLQRARTYIYTTALPPALAEATCAAVRLAQAESWRRERLDALIHRFRAGVDRLGLGLQPSRTPIQPLVLGANAAVVDAGQRLFEAGFLVGAIRPPTVPAGTARLRVTLSAAHDETDVDRLLEALAELPRYPAMSEVAA